MGEIGEGGKIGKAGKTGEEANAQVAADPMPAARKAWSPPMHAKTSG